MHGSLLALYFLIVVAFCDLYFTWLLSLEPYIFYFTWISVLMLHSWSIDHNYHLGFLIFGIAVLCESFPMDLCCVTLKTSTSLANVSRGFVNNGDNGFWGERIRGSLNSNHWSNQLARSLKFEKTVRTIKPGAAFSVLTSDNGTDTLVSKFYFIFN